MYFDTHSHLNFKAFDDDRDEVIKRTLENDTWIINPSSNYQTSKLAIEIAQQHQQGVFASVGLHPINCVIDLSQAQEDRLENLEIEKYRQLAQQPKVVAIGEIGLDYWNEPKSKAKAEQFKQKQKEVFLAQLQLANDL
ncbi:MAG: TatD family hydrolase, partial [Candidatus Gribaldobacteria bacterium]|nr:TatD family hydrolase [Candidatus Gribaldobacteria bacterium]